MKAGIHPEYKKALITCACGRVSETQSTVGEIHVEICSHCHPFFTGRQKLVDTAGRVERFMAKYGMDDEDGGNEAEETAARTSEAPAEEKVDEPAEEPQAARATEEAAVEGAADEVEDAADEVEDAADEVEEVKAEVEAEEVKE